ncbi:SDR family NAD(P)-dependent oxidoreductase [Fulvivirgaceae bacterium BMA10]|uniref:SDR family NAD(P)-dependent oxidoreductase n=1 Tax=Splendidivirga corallicola TaxID=3051826 RepID=A0ABT8KKN0_9BACT|nr:SDR family NAD(P)-dependent oxidoreductase [Fulvivirgaceae bacterium BMA10]
MKNTALITGAASGIGKEFAKIHAGKGGDIVAVDLNTEGLQSVKTELEEQYGVEVYTITKNLADINAPKEIYDELKSNDIEINYLINNAGFGGVGKFHQRAWEQDLAMIQVDVIALTALTKFFLPDFVGRNEGKVLNVSSTVSLIPGPGQAVYFASKAFVTSLTRSIYGELNDSNVTITALLPGATQTGFGDHSGMNKTAIYKKPANAADVAKDGYEAMMKGELEVISGVSGMQKLEFKLVPLVPKKKLINRMRKGQETK